MYIIHTFFQLWFHLWSLFFITLFHDSHLLVTLVINSNLSNIFTLTDSNHPQPVFFVCQFQLPKCSVFPTIILLSVWCLINFLCVFINAEPCRKKHERKKGIQSSSLFFGRFCGKMVNVFNVAFRTCKGVYFVVSLTGYLFSSSLVCHYSCSPIYCLLLSLAGLFTIYFSCSCRQWGRDCSVYNLLVNFFLLQCFSVHILICVFKFPC